MLIEKQPHHNEKIGGVCFIIHYHVRGILK